MTDSLRCNQTLHCELCSPNASAPNIMRVFARALPGEEGGPRLAICPVHDVAGSVELLPTSIRWAVNA